MKEKLGERKGVLEEIGGGGVVVLPFPALCRSCSMVHTRVNESCEATNRRIVIKGHVWSTSFVFSFTFIMDF